MSSRLGLIPCLFATTLLASIGLTGCADSGDSDPVSGETPDAMPDETDEIGGQMPGADGVRLIDITTRVADGRQTVLTHVWDTPGRLLEQRLFEDGALAVVRRFDWPSDQRFERREDDEGGDGSVDQTVEYTFDPAGRLAGARVTGADGAARETQAYSLDENALVESSVRERDGLLLARETFDYNDGGELQSVLLDSDGDGAADQVRGYGYDDAGVVSGTTLRSLEDNGVLEQATWRYERGACIRNWMNSVFRPICISFR